MNEPTIGFKKFRRKQIAELADWQEGFDMTGVSVSDADKAAGSPKVGDKIARNPKNHADRWLIAADYFADNFEPVERLDSQRVPVEPMTIRYLRGAASSPKENEIIEYIDTLQSALLLAQECEKSADVQLNAVRYRAEAAESRNRSMVELLREPSEGMQIAGVASMGDNYARGFICHIFKAMSEQLLKEVE